MGSLTVTPVIHGQKLNGLAFTQQSTVPTTAGMISHCVHRAIENIREKGYTVSCLNIVFELNFEGPLG